MAIFRRLPFQTWIKLDDDYEDACETRGLKKGRFFRIGRFERELLCGSAWILERFSNRFPRAVFSCAGGNFANFASGSFFIFSGLNFWRSKRAIEKGIEQEEEFKDRASCLLRFGFFDYSRIFIVELLFDFGDGRFWTIRWFFLIFISEILKKRDNERNLDISACGFEEKKIWRYKSETRINLISVFEQNLLKIIIIKKEREGFYKQVFKFDALKQSSKFFVQKNCPLLAAILISYEQRCL